MNTTSLALNGRRQLFALLFAATLAVSAMGASYFMAEGAGMVSTPPALAGDSCVGVG